MSIKSKKKATDLSKQDENFDRSFDPSSKENYPISIGKKKN